MVEQNSPEHIEQRLQTFKDADWVSDQNREQFFDLVDYLKADSNISNRRIIKYTTMYKTLFQKYIDFDMEEATKDDIRRAVGGIESSDYADRTKKDLKDAIKKYYKTRWEDKHSRPDRVRRIIEAQFLKSGKDFEDAYDKTPLKPDEIMAMVEVAENRRDALLPMFFFETGARVGEIEQVTLRDIEIHEKYAEVELISIKNDKDPRTLPLTRCFDLLLKWLEVHPRRDDPDAPLFVNIGSGRGGARRGNPMTQRNFLKTHKKLAQKAGIEKRVTNHVYRHSCASYVNFSLRRMMYHFSWKDPDMARTYCHEDAQQMKEKRLEEEGIDPEGMNDPTLRQTCERCGETWSPTRKFCGECKHTLGTEPVNTQKDADDTASETPAEDHQVAEPEAKVARLD